MKLQLRVLLCGLALQAGLLFCFAHDNTTMHPKITASAAQSSSGLQDFLSGNYVSADEASRVTGWESWLTTGSIYEDIPFWRGFNHFYDPTKHPAIALTDGVDLWAYPSFRWATENLTQAGQQSFPWQIVRVYELNALTNSSQAARETSLAGMLFYLGHVIHLNQDLTVPAHVRNDNHGLNATDGTFATLVMWTENYGRDTYSKQDPTKAFPIQTYHQGWAWWQNTAGFQKLEDFWNRDMLRTVGLQALNDEAKGDVNLGLSEFCNGNFISEHAPYGEFFYFHGKHWFQYPSLAYTSQPNLSPYNLADSVDKIELRNHKEGNRLRLRKTGAGIIVTNHSALNYLAVKNTPKLGNASMQVTLTLHDDKVLQEYHEKLIPKAIEYSAGILDYFFRGTMDARVSLSDTNTSNFTNIVWNTSGQDFHGGTFYVVQDSNTVRSILWHTNLADLLRNPDASFTNGTRLDIPTPGTPTNKLLLVYQGTIGWTNGAALDPVDSNICVAAGSPLEQTIIYTYQPSLESLGLTNGSTIISNLASENFYFTPTTGNYKVTINQAYMDDNGAIGCDINGIGGIQAPLVATNDCDWPHLPILNTDVPAEDVAIVGNHLQVNITATDNWCCGDGIGWWNVSITWRAWPTP